MPDTVHSPADTAYLTGLIHRLTWLREDVAFGLDPRGIAAALADVITDLQETRKQAGQ